MRDTFPFYIKFYLDEKGYTWALRGDAASFQCARDAADKAQIEARRIYFDSTPPTQVE